MVAGLTYARSIQNKLAFTKRKATSILCLIGCLASMVYATSALGFILQIADTFVNNIVVIISVFVECIIFAWIFKAEKLIGFLNNRSKTIKIGKLWLIQIKYIIPFILIVIWIGGLMLYLL